MSYPLCDNSLMNTIGIIIEITGWAAFAMLLGVVCIIHYAAKRIRTERVRKLPIRDLLDRL
jgi:hypothetical protein